MVEKAGNIAKNEQDAADLAVRNGTKKIGNTGYYMTLDAGYDVDTYLEAHSEEANKAVRKALEKNGTKNDNATYNGNVPKGTVIRVGGVDFMKMGSDVDGYWTAVTKNSGFGNGNVFYNGNVYSLVRKINDIMSDENNRNRFPKYPSNGYTSITEGNLKGLNAFGTSHYITYYNGDWYLSVKN